LAYLIVEKKIPLVDAYNYVTTLRSFVRPNNRFLFQLAMLEVQMGEGCSVYYHKDWRFYEFNLFRAEAVPPRDSIGLFSTLQLLYHQPKSDII
jgi:hypothetical protein